jgi:lipopolysaccharide biosynthesis glycosyltransferase
MNILFSINAKFIDLTKTCIRSIIRFDKNIDFYILHHDLNQEHMDDLRCTFLECTFYFIEVLCAFSSRYIHILFLYLFVHNLRKQLI